MRVPLSAALLAVGVSLAAAGPARADNYLVTGLEDSVSSPACTLMFEATYTCTTLRAAVSEANEASNADIISLTAPGDYTLSVGQITLSNDVTIAGGGPDSTAIVANGATRAISVAGAGTDASLSALTVRGGVSVPDDGGNILVGVGTTLSLTLARVTGGTADNGGGIANGGSVLVNSSVVDGNTANVSGGGIYNDGSIDVGPSLDVVNSTIAQNTAPAGGAIRSSADNLASEVRLSYSTIGRNSGGGLLFDGPQATSADASIVASNGGANCAGGTLSGATTSVESGTDCGFGDAGNRQSVDPGLSATLVDAGGEAGTDVLTIPAGSPAVDLVTQCLFPYDQRFEPRFTVAGAACDAGAYEQSPDGTGGQPPPPPPPPPPVPTPVPTVTPLVGDPPVAGQSVGAETVTGKVLVKLPGTSKFVPLDESVIKNGAEIDARDGVVELTRSDGGHAKIYDGIFKLSQPGGITTLTLSEKLTGCKKTSGGGKASAAAKKPKTRKLWGDGTGKFRTRGQYSAATIRGTKWLVQDTCTTTITKVTQGAVSVQDLVKNKTIVLRKGKSYTAKARR